jgi:putative (di)nucleoside polyphosphate hydrolase
MSKYPYRVGVINAIIKDKDSKFLLVQKRYYKEDEWDFAGGGIEINENPVETIRRELREELGTDKFELIKESPIIHMYDWPKENQEAGYKKYGKWYNGQRKHQFVMRFTGNPKDIKIKENEIRRIKWVEYRELKNHLIFEDQWENAERVIQEAAILS